MKFYIGTSGYSYKEWQGTFYPDKIPPRDMLHFYGERLGAVEINNTFYHMPTADGLTRWTRQVPADFTFAFKAPRVITHRLRLKNAASEIQYLFRTLSVLHRKLGPVLFQLPRSFPADPNVLENFLALLPQEICCAFEFRNSSWLTDDTRNLLARNKRILCITDTDEHPAAAIVRTAPWGYLRLRRGDYTDADLSSWRDQISAQKWNAVFVFFKHEDRAKGPELAMRFRKIAEA